ncbi:MAG: lytic transglycosylase domain-containing protein [Bdellovibrio sp.]|nr:lytic transglycosylase domain-containing protein [Bdellovibrio sp.]
MKFFVFLSAVIFLSSASLKAQELRSTWSPPQFGMTKAIGYSSDTFAVPESLKPDVDFWIRIYTKYTTQQGVFHIAGDTQKILGDIDLSETFTNPQWSDIRKELEAELVIKKARKKIAALHKIKNINQIRLQMGLKDRMLKAIELSGLYLPMMEKIFTEKKLPLELTRMVFVESSFNIEAGSKAGASGLWQIMPRLARKFKYINVSYDQRNHPVYSTQLAAQILKENYQILKSWPLAVTAYNHGVGSLKKIVKKYGVRDIGYLADNVKAKKSFGFASRNFYATFLAALHVESHANLYFPEPIIKRSELKPRELRITKAMKYEQLLAMFDDDKDSLKLYNPHLRSKFLKQGRTLPAKTILCLPESSKKRTAEIENP